MSLEIIRFLRHMALHIFGHIALPPQARCLLLTNLKTYLITRISKHQAIDGKPEAYGGAYENRVCARLKTGAT